MNELAIQIHRLGKAYQIGLPRRPRVKHLREDLAALPQRIGSGLSGKRRDRPTFWALKDISLEIRAGEAVGIIGRNGAGKSTLLKILSRITDPTEGQAELYGRVGSLLEVGTGFHMDLTGRENIFLSGAVLGMRRREIVSKLDEIVSFAEVERFIDTPVKHYSSGMFVRLAFAVAAHLEPEILIVDEVLAVGDAAFQKKCLGRMGQVADRGRTVVFVSHNMTAMRSFCQRAILLDQGRIVADGLTDQVTQRYLNAGNAAVGHRVWPDDARPGNDDFKVIEVHLWNGRDQVTTQLNLSEDAQVAIGFQVLRSGARAQFALRLLDAEGREVLASLSNTPENSYHGKPLTNGRYRCLCRLPGNLLNDGRYHISIVGASGYWTDSFLLNEILAFDALDDGLLRGDYPGSYGSVIRPKLVWTTRRL